MKADKYIALHTEFSRRNAYDLIGEKKVTVNGKTANYTTTVKDGDKVEIEGVLAKEKKFKPVIIAYHKPKVTNNSSSFKSNSK